jgi:3-hydroxymyristoyl/3-hydroxydecanoyl-(acyl carrier protein) dehydratase
MRFLFVDRLLQLSPAKFVQGIKHITWDDFYLTKDDEGRFCFIPSLIGESLGQLAAWNVMFANGFTKRPVAGLAASARVYRPAYVGETLLLESFIDKLDDELVQYHSVARIGSDVVFTIDGALGPLLPMEDFIDPRLIRQQFDEINRPGQLVEVPVNSSVLMKRAPSQVAKMLFDRVFDSEPGVRLRAEKRVSRAAPYFPDHFPNKPVLPMTVLLECKLNLVREFLSQAQFSTPYFVRELRKIKMNEFIYPGDVVITTLSVKKQDADGLVLSFRSEVDGKRVCVLDMVLR